MPDQYIVRAPGRICLFGDHQDYLQLPVIACAINRYIEIKARPNNSRQFNIFKLDLEEQERIDLDQPLSNIDNEDYLRLALRVLSRHGCKPDRGFDIHISGNIPINAGLSSSSALTVAWIQFLIEAFGIEGKKNAALVARLAYETEVLERGSSGGKMDQYTIAIGGMIYLETSNDTVEHLSSRLDGLIIGVSGIAKDTFGLLAHLKKSAWEAIHQVTAKYPDFQIDKAVETDIERYSQFIDPPLRPFFSAAILNHQITQKARSALKSETLDLPHIGNLINQHHQLLRDHLKITPPRIDAMIDNALQAGALGAKIVGSGGGGCIVALAPQGREQAIIDAIKEAGAVDAFLVEQSLGKK